MLKAFLLIALIGGSPQVIGSYDDATDCYLATLERESETTWATCYPTNEIAEEQWAELQAQEHGLWSGDF